MDPVELAGKLLGMGEADGKRDFLNVLLSPQAAAHLDGPDRDQPVLEPEPAIILEPTPQSPRRYPEANREFFDAIPRIPAMQRKTAQVPAGRAPDARPPGNGRVSEESKFLGRTFDPVRLPTG